MALQTQGTQEYGDAINKVSIDPTAKTMTFSGNFQLSINKSKFNLTGNEVNDAILTQAQALLAAQFGAL